MFLPDMGAEMDIETEINDLKRRVGDLEGAVNVLAGQLGKVHPELVAMGDRTIQRFDAMEGLMNRAVNRLDTVNTQVWSLRDDLQHLVAAAMRQSRETEQ